MTHDVQSAQHAARMKSLGAAFAEKPAEGADAERRHRWTDTEIATCHAMAFAALRLGDEPALAAAIQMFGGLPLDIAPGPAHSPPPHGSCILWAAAQLPDAFGFEAILGANQKEAFRLASSGRLAHAPDVGSLESRWLRRGLVNVGQACSSDDFRIAHAPRQAAERSRHLASPVAACLSADNPVALGVLLSSPARFAALAASEPLGAFAPSASSRGARPRPLDLALDAESQDAWIEKTLLWHAVGARAWRCAALLACIPEFSTAPLTIGRLGFGHAMSCRDTNGADRNVYAPPNIFEKIFNVAEESMARGNWSNKAESWMTMVEAVALAAPEAARSWRSEEGLGVVDMFMGRECSGSSHRIFEIRSPSSPETAAAGLRLIGAFESAGFSIDWDAVASMCRRMPELARAIAAKGAAAKEALALEQAASPTSRLASNSHSLRI